MLRPRPKPGPPVPPVPARASTNSAIRCPLRLRIVNLPLARSPLRVTAATWAARDDGAATFRSGSAVTSYHFAVMLAATLGDRERHLMVTDVLLLQCRLIRTFSLLFNGSSSNSPASATGTAAPRSPTTTAPGTRTRHHRFCTTETI